MNRMFRDRADAGRQLAQQLMFYAHQPQAIVLALPRGGVQVAEPIARLLQLPLDICLVHKLGVPNQPEVAMGAIDLQGRRYLNEKIITALKISPARIDRVAEQELSELQRRDRVYRGNRPALNLRDLTAIVVDDGLATGATMRSAIESIRLHQPNKIIVAVPIAFSKAADEILAIVDLFVCLTMPQPFHAIGAWYENFAQTTDAEVCEILARSANN